MKKNIIVPLITPFNKDYSVNYDRLKDLVEYNLKNGADGFYVGGSSAECFFLTTEERKKVLETVVNNANGSYVIAHVGDIGTDKTLILAKHAEEVGANGLSSVPPFYFKYGFNEIKGYFDDLARATNLPLTIYNIPALTGKGFTMSEMVQLLKNEKIDSMKYTDTNYYALGQLKKESGKFIYSGCDECFISALVQGADGAIGTNFNFMVNKFVNVYNNFKEGNIAQAMEGQKEINEVIRVVLDNGLIDCVKYLTTLVVGDMGDCRKPFLPLTEEKKRNLELIAKKHL